jgi:hypothetical protein
MGTSFRIVEDDSLRVTEGGYEVGIRLNWYRSLPLSCVETVRLALDGTWVDPDMIRFRINNHDYRLSELAEQLEEFWFVQDAAILHIDQPGKVATGESHTIEVEIGFRAPYIPIGPDQYLFNTGTYKTTQIVG